MRYVLLVLSVLFVAAIALAQVCPSPAPGDYPRHRPQGEPANYPPPGEPACYMRSTQEAASYISCHLCHDYMHRRAA